MASKSLSCTRGRNLLFLSPVRPSSGGSGLAIRALAVLRALRSHYRIHLLVISPWLQESRSPNSLPEGIQIVEVPDDLFRRSNGADRVSAGRRISPHEWPLLTADQAAFLNDLGERLCIDQVHVFRLYMAPYAAPFLGKISCHLDLDEVESGTRLRHAEICAQTGNATLAREHTISARFYESAERAWLEKFDEIFVSSDLAAQDLGKTYHGVPIRVLPNVVEIPALLSPLWPGNTFTLLFVGNMGYYPNRGAVDFLANEIVPALRRVLKEPFKVNLIGSGELPAHQVRTFPPEVSWLGYLTDLAPVYEQCHVVVAPIRSGGGTRIKILEAFAHTRPVVATSMGVEGLPVETGIHYLVADSTREFANACSRLRKCEALRIRLAKNAYTLVRQRFTQNRLEEILRG